MHHNYLQLLYRMRHTSDSFCVFTKDAAYRLLFIHGTIRHADEICKVQSKSITITSRYYIT